MVEAEGADLVDAQLVKRPEYDSLSAPLGLEADYFNLLRLAALDFVDLGGTDMTAAPAAEAHRDPDREPAYTKLATDDLFAILPADTVSSADIIFLADVVPPLDVAPPADVVLPVGDEAVDDVAEPSSDVSSPEADSDETADGDAGVDTYPFEEGLPHELEAMKGFIRKAFAAMADDVEPGDTPGFSLDGSPPCLSIDPVEFLGG